MGTTSTSPASCVDCAVRGPGCFCSLSTQALASLEHLGERLHFERHQRILHEGSRPDHVFVLCQGTVKLTTSSREGRLLILRIAGPGDVLGLAAALRPHRYEATAETLEASELKAIPRAAFMHFMDEFRDVSLNSAMSVAREYESVVLSARRLALSGSAGGKLASVLVHWAKQVNHFEDGFLTFRMPLTHEELGHMAGISRETTTRLLTSFRKTRMLSLTGETIILLAPDRLARLFS